MQVMEAQAAAQQAKLDEEAAAQQAKLDEEAAKEADKAAAKKAKKQRQKAKKQQQQQQEEQQQQALKAQSSDTNDQTCCAAKVQVSDNAQKQLLARQHSGRQHEEQLQPVAPYSSANQRQQKPKQRKQQQQKLEDVDKSEVAGATSQQTGADSGLGDAQQLAALTLHETASTVAAEQMGSQSLPDSVCQADLADQQEQRSSTPLPDDQASTGGSTVMPVALPDEAATSGPARGVQEGSAEPLRAESVQQPESKAKSQPLDADAYTADAEGSVRPAAPRKQGREAIPDLLCCPLTQVSMLHQNVNHAVNLAS